MSIKKHINNLKENDYFNSISYTSEEMEDMKSSRENEEQTSYQRNSLKSKDSIDMEMRRSIYFSDGSIDLTTAFLEVASYSLGGQQFEKKPSMSYHSSSADNNQWTTFYDHRKGQHSNVGYYSLYPVSSIEQYMQLNSMLFRCPISPSEEISQEMVSKNSSCSDQISSKAPSSSKNLTKRMSDLPFELKMKFDESDSISLLLCLQNLGYRIGIDASTYENQAILRREITKLRTRCRLASTDSVSNSSPCAHSNAVGRADSLKKLTRILKRGESVTVNTEEKKPLLSRLSGVMSKRIRSREYRKPSNCDESFVDNDYAETLKTLNIAEFRGDDRTNDDSSTSKRRISLQSNTTDVSDIPRSRKLSSFKWGFGLKKSNQPRDEPLHPLPSIKDMVEDEESFLPQTVVVWR